MPRDGYAGARAGSVEGPWELPEGWRWERLGNLGAWFGGGTPSKSNPAFWTGGTLPWVSPKDMKTACIEDAEDHITPAALAASATKIVPTGSVIFVMRSGILKHSLPVAVTRRDVSLNQDLRALCPRPDVLPDFIAYYARRAARNILHECSKDGTTVNSIDTDRLMSWPVPMPELDAQRAIVARIDTLFADIEDGERALAEARAGVETYRKALLKAAVTGELTADWRRANPPAETGQDLLRRILADRRARWEGDPKNRGKQYVEPARPETESLPELPASWCWASMAQLITDGPSNGYSPKASQNGRGTLSLKLTATSSGTMRLSAECTKTLSETIDSDSELFLQLGDLLFQRGNTRELVGIAAIYDGPPSSYVYPDLMIRVRTSSLALTAWLWRWANSPHGRAYMMGKAQGAAGSMPKISGQTVREMPVPLPPETEMRAALEMILQALELTATGGAAIADCGPNDLRQSILAAAFRGDLVA